MSQQKLITCLCFVILVVPFLFSFGHASTHAQPRYTSGQVGMYLYRNKVVKGYEKYDEAGKLTGKVLIQRDGDGNMISRTGYDASGTALKRFDYEIKNGLMLKKTRFDQDNKMLWYAVYQYDDQGRRMEQVNYDEQGSMKKKTVFHHDFNGERIRSESYDADGRPGKIRVNLYDAQQRRVRDLSVDRTGEISGSTKYIYGDTGFISRIEYIGKDGGLKGYTEIDCDAEGKRLTKKSYDQDGELKNITKYLY